MALKFEEFEESHGCDLYDLRLHIKKQETKKQGLRIESQKWIWLMNKAVMQIVASASAFTVPETYQPNAAGIYSCNK